MGGRGGGKKGYGTASVAETGKSQRNQRKKKKKELKKKRDDVKIITKYKKS